MFTESGVWKNPATNRMTSYKGDNVKVVVLDNGRFQVTENTQGKNYSFCLELDFFKIANTDIYGYGEQAIDADTKQETEYCARPMFDEDGNVLAVRLDCVDRPWFWCEIDIFF